MTVFVNPGSGPVAEATEEAAWASLQVFLDDLEKQRGLRFHTQRPDPPVTGGDGRWHYRVFVEGESYEIEMPGLPVERVRWMGEESGSIWDFPRLYVDGDSWIWKFALDACGPDDD